jgi:hypothetical protein
MTESPVQAMPAAPTVLACGAWLKNAACLLVGNQPRVVSPAWRFERPRSMFWH